MTSPHETNRSSLNSLLHVCVNVCACPCRTHSLFCSYEKGCAGEHGNCVTSCLLLPIFSTPSIRGSTPNPVVFSILYCGKQFFSILDFYFPPSLPLSFCLISPPFSSHIFSPYLITSSKSNHSRSGEIDFSIMILHMHLL